MVSIAGYWRKFLIASALALGGLAASPAYSQDPATTAAPGTVNAAARAAVDGFRSAKFGMTMDQVREAIAADFDLSGEAVGEGENVAERTALLTIRVDDVLKDGGPAQVSYVFGYESKTLIQVGILWDIQSSSEARLLANAEVLASYFQSAGYDPATIRSSLALDNGLLIFRGEDAEGRATVLLLQGTFTDAGEQRRSLAPTALALLYAVDADNPDVFRIQSGQF